MLKLILGWVQKKQKKILKFTDELAEELYKPVTRKFPTSTVSMQFGLLS